MVMMTYRAEDNTYLSAIVAVFEDSRLLVEMVNR
jgi:hypothetical protein